LKIHSFFSVDKIGIVDIIYHNKGDIMVRTTMRLIFVLVVMVPVLLNGAKVGVLHLKSVGVASETAEAVAQLLANELANLGHKVLNPDAVDAAVGEVLQCYEANCAAEAGFKAQVERMIFGSVSRFGEKYCAGFCGQCIYKGSRLVRQSCSKNC
jgi:hypothetical protein